MDGVPVGSRLEAWLRRPGHRLDDAIRRALDSLREARKTTHMQPSELVEEQFAAPEPSPIEAIIAGAQAGATGPSPERRVALLAERERMQEIANGYRRTFGEKAQARGRIKEINAELAGNTDQKEAAKWIKARSRSLGGAFDADVVAAAFRFLPPGWSIEETSAFYPITASNTDAVDLWIGAILGRRVVLDVRDEWERKGWFTITAREWHNYSTKQMEPADTGALMALKDRVRVVAADRKGKAILPAAAEAGVLYTAERTQGDAHLSLYRIVLGVRGWTVTAPDGASFTLPEKPLGRGEAIPGDTLFKWAFGHGLAEQATAAVARAEAAVPAALSIGRDEWARNLCQICFGAWALTPRGNALVDHGHRRPGWGYNVEPCHGSRHAPYADSCNITAGHTNHLVQQLADKRAWLATLTAGKDERGWLTFSVLEYVTDDKGRRVPEPDEGRQRVFGDWKVQTVTIQHDDPRWERVRQNLAAMTKGAIQSLRAQIPFYRAAVRLWGAWVHDAPLHEVYGRIVRGIHAVDREGL